MSAAALADDVRAFRNYLKAERGMAANTVLAYGRDLDRFAAWAADGATLFYTVEDAAKRAWRLYRRRLDEEAKEGAAGLLVSGLAQEQKRNVARP